MVHEWRAHARVDNVHCVQHAKNVDKPISPDNNNSNFKTNIKIVSSKQIQ